MEAVMPHHRRATHGKGVDYQIGDRYRVGLADVETLERAGLAKRIGVMPANRETQRAQAKTRSNYNGWFKKTGA